MKQFLLLMFLGIMLPCLSIAQKEISSIHFDAGTLAVKSISYRDGSGDHFPINISLFSALIDSNLYFSSSSVHSRVNDTLFFTISDSISCWLVEDKAQKPGLKYTIRFINKGKAKHSIENLVPLGAGKDRVYISAEGSKEWPGYLCRSKLYRPGCGPVGVVLPDNAWHLGFNDLRVSEVNSITALARRGQRNKDKTDIDRWKVTLKPGGWAEYNLWFDVHEGDWHNGLKMMFQDRWLYDLDAFNMDLFNRADLQWMNDKYIMLLQFAWDKKYFDYSKQEHTFYTRLFEYDSLTGGFDVFTLWPTWPRLGLDQRNQWDMYRDLPGGLEELRKQSDFVHAFGKKYFISYNPWDAGTRPEDQFLGMEQLLRATNADGVVLDTKGESSKELQATADKVRPGIIMYSEGMAVPRDMPGIVSGRVHDALVQPPPLNLNKFIKPDFAIFRVLQLADDRLHRELAISFFNGYGVEINTMRPGRPEWIEEEFEYLGKTTRILRENNSVFNNYSFKPLIKSLVDSVYVNSWKSHYKTLFTIYSENPAGCNSVLFEIDSVNGPDVYPNVAHYRFIDLWNHEEIAPESASRSLKIPVKIDPFNRDFLGSRREGNAGCIAIFLKSLKVDLQGRFIHFSADKGDRIVITFENPTYRSRQFIFDTSADSISYINNSNSISEKIVIQLFKFTEIIDEVIVAIPDGKPVLISRVVATPKTKKAPAGMAEIPPGAFNFYTKRDPSTLEPFIPLPDFSDTIAYSMPRLYVDRYPVTNMEYFNFINQTGYIPSDTTNYLKHWINRKPAPGTANHPVVYVNLDDARAFAGWAGKRLPTELEWQYAAQGNDMRKYPWGDKMMDKRCNNNLNYPTSVNAYPKGTSPFGVEDLVGNVWQMTNDVYDNGAYFFNIIRGGSYYHPTQSIWYVTGGPMPVDHPEILLLIAPSLDRNATVGFRCVKDAE